VEVEFGLESSDVHVPSPLTKDILENNFTYNLFVISLNLFDKYQNLFDNSFYTIPKTMSRGWRYMSTTPTSLNNLNVSFIFFIIVLFDICLNLFDNCQNSNFTPTPAISDFLNLIYSIIWFPVSPAPTFWIFNFFFTIVFFDICLNLLDNFQNHYFTPIPVISEKPDFPCPPYFLNIKLFFYHCLVWHLFEKF
jgi:hypothetical protein